MTCAFAAFFPLPSRGPRGEPFDYNGSGKLDGDRRKALMLIISQQQLRVFQPLAEASLVRKIANHLATHHGTSIVRCSFGVFTLAKTPNEVLERLIRSGIRSARRYGFSWESDLAAFVVLMFVVSPNFDDFPSVRQILLDQSMSPDSRLSELWDETSEEEWEQMKENYNPDGWTQRQGGAVLA